MRLEPGEDTWRTGPMKRLLIDGMNAGGRAQQGAQF